MTIKIEYIADCSIIRSVAIFNRHAYRSVGPVDPEDSLKVTTVNKRMTTMIWQFSPSFGIISDGMHQTSFHVCRSHPGSDFPEKLRRDPDRSKQHVCPVKSISSISALRRKCCIEKPSVSEYQQRGGWFALAVRAFITPDWLPAHRDIRNRTIRTLIVSIL